MGKKEDGGENDRFTLEEFFLAQTRSAKSALHYVGKNLEGVDAELEEAMREHDESHKRLMRALRDSKSTVQKEGGRANAMWAQLDRAVGKAKKR